MGMTCVCHIEPFKFRLTITIISLKRTINLLIIIKKIKKKKIYKALWPRPNFRHRQKVARLCF